MQENAVSPEWQALAEAMARAASAVSKAFREQMVPVVLKAIEDHKGLLAPPGSEAHKAFLARQAQAAERARKATQDLKARLARPARPALDPRPSSATPRSPRRSPSQSPPASASATAFPAQVC